MGASTTFMPEVKEREAGQPCFVVLNTGTDIGIGRQMITFDLPQGSTVDRAQELARILREFDLRVRIS